MADTPTIWRISDDATVVTADGFEKNSTVTGHGVFVFFEGDREPRGFRSTVRSSVWEYTFRFAPANVSGPEQLLDMLGDAFLAADARLVIDPGGKIAGQTVIVEVHSWSRQIVKVVGYQEISFTATEVRA